MFKQIFHVFPTFFNEIIEKAVLLYSWSNCHGLRDFFTEAFRRVSVSFIVCHTQRILIDRPPSHIHANEQLREVKLALMIRNNRQRKRDSFLKTYFQGTSVQVSVIQRDLKTELIIIWRPHSIRATKFRSYQLNYRHSATETDSGQDLIIVLAEE